MKTKAIKRALRRHITLSLLSASFFVGAIVIIVNFNNLTDLFGIAGCFISTLVILDAAKDSLYI